MAWQPSIARAGEEDVQLWLVASARTDLSEETSLTLDGSLRFREEARGGAQQTVRFTLEHRVEDGVVIGGGAGVFEAAGNTELRAHQQAVLSKGGFSARTRLEQRFFDGADRMDLRFRQRIGYRQPLGQGWSAGVEGEWLYLLQPRNNGASARTDQWRARVELRHQFDNGVTLGAAYMAILSPRDTAPDRINHVPQAVVALRF